MALSGESWVADVTEFPFKRPFLPPIRYGCVFTASKCLQAEYSKQAQGDSLIFWRNVALKIGFVGSDYPLAAGEHSLHPEHDLFRLPSLLHCHTLSIGMQLAKEFLHLPKEEWIFFFSKITVVGGLTLQVLLIWTVSSLGGFPSNCPHHPSLHHTHTSKH